MQEEREYLLTSIDGVEMFQGDKFYYVWMSGKISHCTMPNTDGKYYSSFESAKQSEYYKRANPITASFCEAMRAIDLGCLVYRLGWNGKNLRVYKQNKTVCSLDIVPKMTSFSDNVKSYLIKNQITPSYRHQMSIIAPDGTIDSWIPSISDIHENDWIIEGEPSSPELKDGIIHDEK